MKSKEVLDAFDKLNKENREFFQKLVNEVQYRTIGRDNKQTVKLLKHVLRDILTAQNNNIMAKEFIGNDIEKIADEITSKISFNYFETFKLIVFGLLIYSIFAILPCLISPNKMMDLGGFLITVVYFAAYALVLLLYIAKTDLSSEQNKYSNLFNAFLVTIGFGIGLLMFWFISTPYKIYFVGTLKYVSIFFIVFGLLSMFIHEERKRLWLPFFPLFIFCTTLGVISRMESLKPFFLSNYGKFVVSIILLFIAIVQYIILYRYFKKVNKNRFKKKT